MEEIICAIHEQSGIGRAEVKTSAYGHYVKVTLPIQVRGRTKQRTFLALLGRKLRAQGFIGRTAVRSNYLVEAGAPIRGVRKVVEKGRKSAVIAFHECDYPDTLWLATWDHLTPQKRRAYDRLFRELRKKH